MSLNRPIVLDASVGLGIIRKEPGWKGALDSLRLRRVAESPLLVPWLFWLEVINVLSRRYRLAPPIVVEAIVELEAMGLESIELDRPSLLLALDVVARLRLSAYDAAYLALAETADAQLLTADVRLAAAAGDRALHMDGRHRTREDSADYAERSDPDSSWAAWPGAAAYLRELRTRVRTPTTG